MSNKISNERKSIYYLGLGLTVLGVVLFMSSFFIGASEMDLGFGMDMGMPSFFKVALIGMICIMVGGVLMNIGAKGAAGSGLILDPEKARDDLKPYSSAAGGMISDAMENIDLSKIKEKNKGGKELIKIRCRSCGELNDEDSKFCKSCGERI